MKCCENPDVRFINRYKNLKTKEYLTVEETLVFEKEMREAGFETLSLCKQVEGGYLMNPWYWDYSQNAMPSMNKVCRNCGEVELFERNEMRVKLSPERVKEMYESKIRRLAQIKWEEAGKPENRDLEFWLVAEKEQCEKDMRFGEPLKESALPNFE